MRRLKTFTPIFAIIGSCGAAEPAKAQVVYAGGDSGAAPLYRQLFDCHSIQVDGNPSGPTWPYPGGAFEPAYPISPSCPNWTGDNSGLFMQILYVPVGSGAGKRALIAHDGSSNATGFGAAPPVHLPYVSGLIPGLTDRYGYPSVQFIGSDDPWNATDAANYAASGNQAKYGNIIQMPAASMAVTIVYRPTSAGNSDAPSGSMIDKDRFHYLGDYGKLNLTRKALCGIFTGHITNWNDPEIAKTNGAQPWPITVVYRTDRSGMTFLLANALHHQCKGITGPINTADALSAAPHIRSWEFRFSDHTNAACPDLLYRPSSSIDWPSSNPPAVDGCGNTLIPPPGSNFVGASGDDGMKRTIETTLGSIGYATMAYAQPVLSTGMRVANIQSQYDLDNNTGAFQWPSPTTISNAMAAATPIFPDATARANPLNWSSQSQVPNPATRNSYPIVGFSWFDFYQCYSQTRDQGLGLGTFENLQNYLGFHYYNYASYFDQTYSPFLNSQGFAAIPNVWLDEIIPLISDGPSMMGIGGDPSNPVCSTRQGA